MRSAFDACAEPAVARRRPLWSPRCKILRLLNPNRMCNSHAVGARRTPSCRVYATFCGEGPAWQAVLGSCIGQERFCMQSWFNKLLPALALACTGSAEAATYYVRNGGSDTADGRSHSTAWATLGRVNSFSFATGDVVLLHEGHRFVGRVTVDWAGTASARAVLGAYYLDGST